MTSIFTFSFSIPPSTDYYGNYTKKCGGRQYKYYSKSGDKFLKDLSSWVSQAESSIEKESRKEVKALFGVFLRSIPGSDDNRELLSQICEFRMLGERDCVCIINLEGKSLTSFPTKLPCFTTKIESLNLANNFLKKIPGEGDYTSLNMSGNPLYECLDSIKVNTQFLDLKKCGIKELTTNLFSYFKEMAGRHENLSPRYHLNNEILYEIDLSSNPLSEKSLSLIKAYAAEGNTIPEIIYDEGDSTRLKSSSLAKAAKEKMFLKNEVNNLAEKNKIDKYVPGVAQIITEYNKERERRIANSMKIQSDFKNVVEHFGIGVPINIKNSIKVVVIKFLEGLQPLSNQDLQFRKYVGDVFNNVFKDKYLTESLFESLGENNQITFNKINECMLMKKVKEGIFDNEPETLAQLLRNVFLSTKIKEKYPGSELDFVRWESLLKDELKMDIQKKCCKNFSPLKFELVRMKEHTLSAEKEDLKNFIENHAIWKEFVRRTLPED